VALVGLLAATAFVASAPPASAHARLVSISPSDGTTAATPPSQVVITFSEDLLATAVRIEVKDAGGKTVTDGAPVVTGAVATQPLAGVLESGRYAVTYRVVSKDGHPVSGSTTFTVASAAATSTAQPEPSTSSSSRSTAPATSAATTAATAPSGAQDSGSAWPAIGIGLLVLLLAGAAFALYRRRTALH
jgi:methionine-rich copper-binding protein CopC